MIVSDGSLKPENLREFLSNVVKAIHLTIYHSEPEIGAPILQDFQHRVRKAIRDNIDYFPEELRDDLKSIQNLTKNCYECISQRDKTRVLKLIFII
jgi:flagellar motor switch protein FliG